MRRGVTLGQMLLGLTIGLLLTFIILGPECDVPNADSPECRGNICEPP